MTASDNLQPQQFYHSTNAELSPGDVVQPGHKTPGKPYHFSDDFSDLGHDQFTWMTTEKPGPNSIPHYGRNHYEVEPLGLHHSYSFSMAKGGSRTPDHDGSWVSLAGAKVIRKVGEDEPRIGDTK